MCGIAGYKGAEDATQIVIEGLRRLEYRGYDSWGVASINHDHIELFRREGRIGQVSVSSIGRSSGISIGHTRWATHGGVSESNAHPHLSFDSKVAVVHNGIIENYQELRSDLKSRGIALQSQTDTEVIPHLIALELGQDTSFAEAVRRTCRRLKGSYAIVAVHQDFDEIVVARDGSPVVIGTRVDESDKEFFVASDVTAFLDRTKDVVYLRDGDLAVINSSLDVKRISDSSHVDFKAETVPWSLEEASKGEYHHFMLKEIHEQPQVVMSALAQDESALASASSWIGAASKVIIVACGTSALAGKVGQAYFRALAGKDVQVVIGSESDSILPCVSSRDVMIAVSQSGETADTMHAAKTAKAKGARIISIVNATGSSLSRISDLVLPMRSGPEICVVATKSYISTVSILARLSSMVAKTDILPFSSLSSLMKSLIASVEPKAAALAVRIAASKDMFVIGRGLLYPTSLEAALKLKETCYIHAEGFAGGELKHGSIALIETGIPVIALADDSTRALIVSNAMEVRARGGWVVGVDTKPNEAYDEFIQVPDVGLLQPLISIVPLQLLAYHVAVIKGLDPDKPRNLAKSVTVK